MRELELGQALFGQPTQMLDCPEKVMRALNTISQAWAALTDSNNPFSNTGAEYKGEKFTVYAYSWREDIPQEYNFAWRDVRVSWYKYFGRGTTINREMTVKEIREMLHECAFEIFGIREADNGKESRS